MGQPLSAVKGTALNPELTNESTQVGKACTQQAVKVPPVDSPRVAVKAKPGACPPPTTTPRPCLPLLPPTPATGNLSLRLSTTQPVALCREGVTH